MSINYAIYAGGRRSGLTTALLDIAIANARAGEYVQYWAHTWSVAEAAFRTAVDRLGATDCMQSVEIHHNPTLGVSNLVFGLKGGRLEFCSSKSAYNTPPKPQVGVTVTDDPESYVGTVVRHHANVRDEHQ